MNAETREALARAARKRIDDFLDWSTAEAMLQRGGYDGWRNGLANYIASGPGSAGEVFDAATAEAGQRALREAADALDDDRHSTNDPSKAVYHGLYAAWLVNRADALAAQRGTPTTGDDQ